MISETDDRLKIFNTNFDKLLQDFRDRATGDTLVTVHRIWGRLESLRETSSSFRQRPS